jgi:AcrR family transcriptional regulator
MDPRAARSGAALRDAVLALAGKAPPAAISVTDLVKAAGVSRKTFYNHAATPGELLAQVLTGELDIARDTAEDEFSMTSSDLRGAVRNRLGAILTHIGDRRDVYFPTPGGIIPPELYQLLTNHFRAAVRESIRSANRVAPGVPGFDDPEHRAVSVEMYSSYVAHAYAGAIQSWLQHPETGEVDFVLDLILTALPSWMVERATGSA